MNDRTPQALATRTASSDNYYESLVNDTLLPAAKAALGSMAGYRREIARLTDSETVGLQCDAEVKLAAAVRAAEARR